MIRLARAHFGLDREGNLRVICADALDFVRDARERYDLIVVDLFVDDQVPPQFRTASFLEATAALLRRGGLLVFNCYVKTSVARAESERFASLFASTLPGGSALPVRNNLLLVYEAAGPEGHFK